MYQEPCCISRKLPAMMQEQSHCFFQTSGDVDIHKMMEAVGRLADGHPVFFAVMPEVDVYLLRELRYYCSRKWFEGIILLTQQAQTEMVRNELSDYIGKVAYGCHRSVLDGAMGIFGIRQSVYLQGPMLLQNDHSLCTYAAYLGQDEAVLRSATEAFFPKIHLSGQIRPSDPRVQSVLHYHFKN